MTDGERWARELLVELRGSVCAARPAIQSLSLLVGAVFLLVGILGFVPGITTIYGDMSFAGEDSVPSSSDSSR